MCLAIVASPLCAVSSGSRLRCRTPSSLFGSLSLNVGGGGLRVERRDPRNHHRSVAFGDLVLAHAGRHDRARQSRDTRACAKDRPSSNETRAASRKRDGVVQLQHAAGCCCCSSSSETVTLDNKISRTSPSDHVSGCTTQRHSRGELQ